MNCLYEENKQDHHIFIKNDRGSQSAAQTLLIELGLDRISRKSLESRWNVQWSNGWTIGDGDDLRRRMLFQWCVFKLIQ